MSNCRPVLPASWQPRHWSEVDELVAYRRAAGGDPRVVVGLGRQPGDGPPGRTRQARRGDGFGKRRVVAVVGLAEARGVVGRQGHQAMVDRGRGGLEEALAQEDQGLSRLSLHVAQAREGEVALCRSVAVHTVLPESHDGVCVLRPRGPVRRPAAPTEPAPEPAVSGSLDVPNHHRRSVGREQIQGVLVRARGRRGREHLLDDQGAVRHGVGVPRGRLPSTGRFVLIQSIISGEYQMTTGAWVPWYCPTHAPSGGSRCRDRCRAAACRASSRRSERGGRSCAGTRRASPRTRSAAGRPAGAPPPRAGAQSRLGRPQRAGPGSLAVEARRLRPEEGRVQQVGNDEHEGTGRSCHSHPHGPASGRRLTQIGSDSGKMGLGQRPFADCPSGRGRSGGTPRHN